MIQKYESMNENEILVNVLIDCIEYLYDDDQIYYAKEQNHEELLQFINNLNSAQFVKLQKFFETMPKLRKEIQYNCPVCGRHHVKLLEGIQSFF